MITELRNARKEDIAEARRQIALGKWDGWRLAEVVEFVARQRIEREREVKNIAFGFEPGALLFA